jgi:hypothetical protein
MTKYRRPDSGYASKNLMLSRYFISIVFVSTVTKLLANSIRSLQYSYAIFILINTTLNYGKSRPSLANTIINKGVASQVNVPSLLVFILLTFYPDFIY